MEIGLPKTKYGRTLLAGVMLASSFLLALGLTYFFVEDNIVVSGILSAAIISVLILFTVIFLKFFYLFKHLIQGTLDKNDENTIVGTIGIVLLSGALWLLFSFDNFTEETKSLLGTGLLLIVLPFLYFIPTINAYTGRHKNRSAIFALNIFLGWTLIGWVAALVWSLSR